MSNLRISVLKREEQEKFYDQILKMLIISDKDFCPPLSMRSSTTQADFTQQQTSVDGIQSYFEEMKKQRFAAAYDGDQLLGFVSFKENYVSPEIGEDDLPNIYLSTLIVSPEARGKGITYSIYENLFDTYKNSNIFTRTWSTNISHTRILSKFGFELFKTIKDDRGKGIDTVYFRKNKE